MNDDKVLIEESQNLIESKKNILIELNHFISETTEIEKKYTEELEHIMPTANEKRETILTDLQNSLADKNYFAKAKLLKELQYQQRTPYFARIKFVSSDLKPIKYDIYIGRYSFLKNGKIPPIVDWRSPAAALYYNYLGSKSDASFTFEIKNSDRALVTKNVNGELKLRRQLVITPNGVEKVFDTAEDMNFLTKALEGKTGGVLETIIDSIQSEQDIVIRSPLDVPIVVQGTAGSGKTTIAIHKISYLLFTHNEFLKESNLLLLLNSPTLIKYVRSTLTDLDITDPHIFSLKNILVKKLKLFVGGYQHEWYEVTHEDYAGDYLVVINHIVEFCNNHSIHILRKISSILGSRKLENFDFDSELKVYEKINYIIKDLNKHLDDLYENEYEKPNPNYENPRIKNIKETIDQLVELSADYNLMNLFNSFLVQNNFEFDDRKSYFLNFLYIFADELWGDTAMPSPKYKYTMVDEGQDYSLLEIETICRLTMDARMSIFGDINQQMSVFRYQDWSKVLELIAARSPKVPKFYNLKTSYRNTKEIAEFNQKILKDFSSNEFLPEPYNRAGVAPLFKSFLSRNEMLESFVVDLKSFLSADFKSACIVDLDEEAVFKTYDFLKSHGIDAVLIDDKLNDFKSNTLYLTSAKNIKGLEFSTIFIIDPSKSFLPYEHVFANRFYVLCSRAINELKIYGISGTTCEFLC